MVQLITSVLIPSLRRVEKLTLCLQSLATQTLLPDEVIVVWQADDINTRDSVEKLQDSLPYSLKLLYCEIPGVVIAENTALDAAKGEIILLCDDDVITPLNWIARHLSFYSDPTIGAVGGPANNHAPDSSLFPKRDIQPIGKLNWYGKCYGNMYDQLDEWTALPPIPVDHLVGYNLSIRRSAFDRFESSFKPYWQMFEIDLCLQVKKKGYKVIFDFANVVDHYPTNATYAPGRDGDLEIKVFNSSYNNALVMAKHSPSYLQIPRLLYMLLIGSINTPGLAASILAIRRYGNFFKELYILKNSLIYKIYGWKKGIELRETNK